MARATHLEDTEQSKQVVPLCGQELQGDRAIDGDVTSHAEASKSNEHSQPSKSTRSARRQAKDARDEAGEVEGPLSTDNVHSDAPAKGADGKAHIEGGGEGANVLPAGSKVSLIAQRYGDQTEHLRPEEVDEEAETAEEEDIPLRGGGGSGEGREAYGMFSTPGRR